MDMNEDLYILWRNTLAIGYSVWFSAVKKQFRHVLLLIRQTNSQPAVNDLLSPEAAWNQYIGSRDLKNIPKTSYNWSFLEAKGQVIFSF